MTLSRVAFLALLISLIYWAPRWMPRSPAKTAPASSEIFSSKELRAGSGSSSVAKADAVQRLLREAEQRRESLSPEQRAIIDDLKVFRGDLSRSAVLEKLQQTLEQKHISPMSFYEWAADAWASTDESYRRIQPQAESWLWALAFLAVALGLGAAVLSKIRLARWSATLGFGLSRGWLVVLSFLAIALTLATRTNPWTSFPSELVLPPLVALIGCALALRAVDLNYPVWNSLVRGCGAPLISMAFVAVYLKLV